MDLGWMAFIAVTFKTLSKFHHLPVVPGAIFPPALFGWLFLVFGEASFFGHFLDERFCARTILMKDLASTFFNGPSSLRPKSRILN